jgi:hypothetical protein
VFINSGGGRRPPLLGKTGGRKHHPNLQDIQKWIKGQRNSRQPPRIIRELSQIIQWFRIINQTETTKTRTIRCAHSWFHKHQVSREEAQTVEETSIGLIKKDGKQMNLNHRKRKLRLDFLLYCFMNHDFIFLPFERILELSNYV